MKRYHMKAIEDDGTLHEYVFWGDFQTVAWEQLDKFVPLERLKSVRVLEEVVG